jgi:hypothetical protein
MCTATAGTVRIQGATWDAFVLWLRPLTKRLDLGTVAACPILFAALLRAFGALLFDGGYPIYMYRHLIAGAQKRYLHLRGGLPAAWDFLSKWEVLEPLQHRPPVPEPLMRAMGAVALGWGWSRWCGALMLAFAGACRPGEVLRATRGELVLPSDVLSTSQVAFLKIGSPKTRHRGGGRVQHVKIEDPVVVSFVAKVFGKLDRDEKLYGASDSAFRRRWDYVLKVLGVPQSARVTPGGIRGGGAIAAYRRGVPIADIMWRMRLRQQKTLEHYLQELAAEDVLAGLPKPAARAVGAAAECFPYWLSRFS